MASSTVSNYDVLEIDSPWGLRSSASRSADKFHGMKISTFSGARPSLIAQASKYQVSHVPGLIFQIASVAKIENNIMASRPAHSAPLP